MKNVSDQYGLRSYIKSVSTAAATGQALTKTKGYLNLKSNTDIWCSNNS